MKTISILRNDPTVHVCINELFFTVEGSVIACLYTRRPFLFALNFEWLEGACRQVSVFYDHPLSPHRNIVAFFLQAVRLLAGGLPLLTFPGGLAVGLLRRRPPRPDAL